VKTARPGPSEPGHTRERPPASTRTMWPRLIRPYGGGARRARPGRTARSAPTVPTRTEIW